MDSRDVLWLGGRNEIIAYDGLVIYDYDFPNQEGIIDDTREIVAAGNGYKYVLTERFLRVLTPTLEWVKLFEVEDNGFRTTRIAEASDGSVWVADRKQLYRIVGEQFQKVDCPVKNISAIIFDTLNRLWIASKAEKRIVVFDPGPISTNLKQIEDVSLQAIKKNSGQLRLHALEDGQVILHRTTGKDTIIRYDALFNSQELVLPEEIDERRGTRLVVLPNNRIIVIQSPLMAQYYNNEWVMLDIEKYPLPPTDAFFEELSNNKVFLGGRLARSFVIDFSDEKWSGYENLSFEADDGEDGYWFLEKDRRVCFFNQKQNVWKALDESDGLIDSPNSIYIDKNGVVWVSGAHDGVAAISFLHEGEWNRKTYPDIGRTFSHLGALESDDGSMVFGNGTVPELQGNKSGGLVIYRKTENSYIGVELFHPLVLSRPATIAERKGDGIWMGGYTLFRTSLNNPLGMEQVGDIETGWVDHIAVDKNQNLWAAVWGEGIHSFDGNEWKTYDISNGLVGNECIFVLPGKKLKGVWIAGREGISRFDGETWSKKLFRSPFILQREGGKLAESTEGDFWVNLSHRDWMLNLNADPRRAEAPHRTIRYRPDRNSPDTRFVSSENQIREPANAFFEWEGFDSWNDTPTDRMEFSYRLSGEEWGPYSGVTQVSLLDLPAGTYTFEVRARDRDWNVDRTPARMTFEVIPPLWKRPSFRFTVALTSISILLLVTLLIRMRLKHILAMKEFKLDFFTNLSHELRTPLTVILGPLEGMVENAKTGQEKRSYEMVLRNARKMLGLVNQLLEFRKVELGKLSFHPAEGELIGFVKDSVYSLAPLWEKKKQTLDIVCERSEYRCGFDPDKLQRIVDNLLSNAIKYTPERGKIVVEIEVFESKGTKLRLAIIDNGVGIPRSKIDHIMEPFYQVQEGDKRQGSGIGLALVRELVELWGGKISINSSYAPPKQGTKVEVTLPLVEASSQLPEMESFQFEPKKVDADTKKRERKVLHPERSRPKVLVVEDNSDLREFLENELSKKFDVVTAENGLVGLDTAFSTHPDLIVSDVMMPEMDGIEFCAKIRENTETSHIPIIILTARSAEEHYLEGIEQGADEFFGKPVKPEILTARIENILRSRQSLRELFSNPSQIIIEPSEVAVVSSDQKLLEGAIEVVEKNFENEEFDVEVFSRQMAMSRATLFRKIKAITGLSPGDFIRTMRLKRAAQLLISTDLTIGEIIGQTGHYDASNFSRSFRKEFGMSPTAYRNANGK